MKLTILPRRLLRDIATSGCVTLQWRDEDVVRTRFRLSLVLRAQEKLEEASAIQKEIATSIENIRSPVSVPSNDTDEDDMKLSRLCDLGFSWSYRWNLELRDVLIGLCSRSAPGMRPRLQVADTVPNCLFVWKR